MDLFQRFSARTSAVKFFCPLNELISLKRAIVNLTRGCPFAGQVITCAGGSLANPDIANRSTAATISRGLSMPVFNTSFDELQQVTNGIPENDNELSFQPRLQRARLLHS